MPALRTLWVASNPITDTGLATALAEPTTLEELNVHGTLVSDAAMNEANGRGGRLRVIRREP
jgi:hypothetical protein